MNDADSCARINRIVVRLFFLAFGMLGRRPVVASADDLTPAQAVACVAPLLSISTTCFDRIRVKLGLLKELFTRANWSKVTLLLGSAAFVFCVVGSFSAEAQSVYIYDVLDRVRTVTRNATGETINIDPSGNITSLQLTLSSSVVNGQCGSASGQPAVTAPVAFLCAAGRPGALAGTGPWTWTCFGRNGGTNATTCGTAAASAATCTAINGPGLTNIPAASSTQTYNAQCSNATGYQWKLDGVILGCTTASCAVTFPANTMPATTAHTVTVAPSTATGSVASIAITQAAAAVAPQCSGGISGATAIAATGGSIGYSTNCLGATSFVWTLQGVTQPCTGASCNLTFPGNTTASTVPRTINVTAANANGNSVLSAVTATVAAAPTTCTFNFTGTGAVTNASAASKDDALLFTRWLFGLRGTTLVSGITPYPTGTSVAQFATNVSARLALGLMHDIDNNGKVDPLTDGLMLIRMTQGLTGSAVTAGAVGAGATRTDYESIRAYTNTNCATAFVPGAVTFYDAFDGVALDSGSWTETRGGAGVVYLSGGIANFEALTSASTQGKRTFSGNKIVAEARFTGPGTFRDPWFALVDAATGDLIWAGDTNYFSFGFYTYGTGQSAFAQQNQSGTTSAYKEYRMTLEGTSAIIERGDALGTFTQTRTVTLPTSIISKSFYIRIGTASPDYSPGAFDWVRVQVF